MIEEMPYISEHLSILRQEITDLRNLNARLSKSGSGARRVLTGGNGWKMAMPNFIRYQLRSKTTEAKVVLGGSKPVEGLGAPTGKGFFVAPTLLESSDARADDPANTLEVFGPVATLMAYDDTGALLKLVAAGGGGLVSSVYSDDKRFLEEVVLGIAPHHGRVTIGNEKLAGQSVSPGTVMPQLLHGGPGRAGGGEELGGMRARK